MNKIKIAENVKYLSEVMDELPINCLFNKGITAAGGTTIALKDNKHTVIAVPFTELIDNKVAQTISDTTGLLPHKVLGVQSGVTDDEIQEYLEDPNNPIKKVIVTYNSLERVMEFIDPSMFTLMVDEYHILFTEYSYRRDAALQVLDNYKLFRSYTFMTATPIEEEFVLEELKDLPIIEAVWQNPKEVTVVPINAVRGVTRSTIVMIQDFLEGKSEGNLYIFVNSVKFIRSILRKVKELDNNNTRVIYSDYNQTKLKIKRGKTMDAPKKINFLTSKAFEGADIYDKDGKVLVVSDTMIGEHTLVDISTKLVQIAGRIRNSKYGDVLYHLTHIGTNRYTKDKLSYEEYKKASRESFDGQEKILIANNSIGNKEWILKLYNTGALPLAVVRDGELVLDENILKIDLYNYKLANNIYKNRINLHSEYKKNDAIKAERTLTHIINKTFANHDDVTVFNRMLKELHELYLGDNELEYLTKYEGAIREYPFLEQAIKELGYDVMKSNGYSKGNIENMIKYNKIKNTKESSSAKIAKVILKDRKIKNGEFYTNAELKKYLTTIHEKLGIEAVAKATDIIKYFSTRKTKRRVDGKGTAGYEILHSLNQLKK